MLAFWLVLNAYQEPTTFKNFKPFSIAFCTCSVTPTFYEENYVCSIAETVEEANALIESSFEYVTEIDEAKLLRKPERSRSLFLEL